MKKFAVILSGAGVYDGSELHEAVITLLSLDRADVDYQCMAPDREQMHVINHLNGVVGVYFSAWRRLVESCRMRCHGDSSCVMN